MKKILIVTPSKLVKSCSCFQNSASNTSRLEVRSTDWENLPEHFSPDILILKSSAVSVDLITRMLVLQRMYRSSELLLCVEEIPQSFGRLIKELKVQCNACLHDSCKRLVQTSVDLDSLLSKLLQNVKSPKSITRQLIELLKARPWEANLSSFAEDLNISPDHASRVFRGDTGYNFRDFINELKLSTAKKMLEDYNADIFEIARKVGFKEVNSFHRFFRSKAGISPKQYYKSIHDRKMKDVI
ncbi:MAG: helix-turn-helix domain-containing protein [Calditrichia bacterium]